ncbi:hypothetical protein AMS68_005064 [Peltaster fructicola]|uniref:DUF1996 domain-containing protein n=1 Tax=Peltaster fructicola TaxID=286661 RepID=A0A6H0XXP6_9PEZI|nr:hypothetical protein AMS68_005064 [Peltaster fructicola]
MLTQTFLTAFAASLPLALANQFVMYTPGGDDTSVQRIDPILSPGSISGHVHQVFGSNALSDTVTYDSLQQADCTTVGDASNHGNAQDNSLYWHPALFMEAKNGSGFVRVPTNGHKIYYRDAGSEKDTKRSPFEFPRGFRMLAGNPFLRQAPSDLHRQNITQWICHRPGKWDQGTAGGFPTGVQDCTDYPGFNGAIHFPHCWNGNDFNPAAPTDHVVYPDGDIEEGICPSSHPIRLPHIFMENQFDLHKVVDQVKPDSFVLAQGDNTGYGWHADFFSGWVDGAIPSLLASCTYQPNEDVGVCSGFQPRSKKASECKLSTKYNEEVTYPGPYLPGCNPIVDTDPAPKMQVAASGIATNVCSTLGAVASIMPTLPVSIPMYSPVASIVGSIAPVVSQGPAADSITQPAGTTVFNAPSAFSIPTTFATFFTTTAAASSAAPSTSSISCPASDGQTYISNGATFQIECNTDHKGGDMSWKWVKNGLTECIDACATTPGCVDVSLSGVACYLKKTLGQSSSNSGVQGAKLISSGSAASTTVTAPATTMTAAPAYGDHGDHDKDVYVQWFTETSFVTVTARPEPFHRRHEDFHAARN